MAKFHHTKLAAAVGKRQGRVATALRAVFAEWARSVAKKLSRVYGEKVKKADPDTEELVRQILEQLDLDPFGQGPGHQVRWDRRRNRELPQGTPGAIQSDR